MGLGICTVQQVHGKKPLRPFMWVFFKDHHNLHTSLYDTGWETSLLSGSVFVDAGTFRLVCMFFFLPNTGMPACARRRISGRLTWFILIEFCWSFRGVIVHQTSVCTAAMEMWSACEALEREREGLPLV